MTSVFSPENAWALILALLAAVYALCRFRHVVAWVRRGLEKRAMRREQRRYEREVEIEEAEMHERLDAREREQAKAAMSAKPAAEPPQEPPPVEAAEAEAEFPPEETGAAEPPGELPEDAPPQELWERARKMPHGFVPGLISDGEYLSLVHAAAVGGHAEACAKLGEYASRRGVLVEAYYWTKLAKWFGRPGVERTLLELRKAWMLQGAQPEYDNVHAMFPEALGSVARAALRLDCGIDAPFARQRLTELERMGVQEARFMHGHAAKADVTSPQERKRE